MIKWHLLLQGCWDFTYTWGSVGLPACHNVSQFLITITIYYEVMNMLGKGAHRLGKGAH